MEITTLIENLVYQSRLVAEHGLSFIWKDVIRRFFSIPDKAIVS